MNEPSLNLLPRDVQRSRLHRRRLRFWAVTCGTYLAGLAVVCGALFVTMGPRTTSAQVELNDLLQQQAEFRTASGRIEPQLRALRQRLESRRALAEQPDHSKLLSMVAACLDSEIVLRHMQVSGSGIDPGGVHGVARAITGGIGAEREPRHFVVTLRGVSRSENGVSRLSDRLRALEVFDDVELQRTGRDAMGESAVAFEVVCTLREGSAGAGEAVAAGGER